MSSTLERTFMTYWKALARGYPMPVPEYQAIPGRKFRFDFAWPDAKIAVELDGGVHAPRGKCCQACGQPPRSRHTTGVGFTRDCEKTNLAAAMGWRVFRATAGMLREDPGNFIDLIKRGF